MNGVKDLLLETLFIVLPIFIYQIFWVDNLRDVRQGGRVWTKLIVALLAGISIILCMTFPIHIFPGVILDLRVIPFIIGIFYGGYQVGIALTVILLTYRFYLGGVGFYATLIVILCELAVFVVLIKYFHRASKQQKILFTGLLSTITAFFITIACFLISSKSGYSLSLGKEVTSKFAFYILLHPIASSLAVFLIESLREKRFLQMEMQRMEKMKAIGELATAVAHEIRNPLTVTRGFLQLLKVPMEQQQYIELAVKEVDTVESVINDYLYITRPKVEMLETLEVQELVNHTLNTIVPYALSQGVELRVSEIESGLNIQAPRDRFIQALINLIKKGIESMPNGGRIGIHASKKNGYVVIGITDNGIGMSKEQIMNLGLPFYSLKEEGTGLDLMFCYRFIQMLNGSIEVKSQKGKGTEFLVKIPMSIRTEQ